MKYLKIFLLLIIYTLPVFSQQKEEKYPVEVSEIKGDLNSKDLYKKDFGRYDGYQIDLYQGEAVHFLAYSKNFQPSIALVNSKGEIVVQSKRNQDKYAEMICSIVASDKYVIYVIGSEHESGKYTLQTAVAEPKALNPALDLNFCDGMEFLASHSRAHFTFIENPEIFKKELMRLENSIDVYMDEEYGAYKAVFYSGSELQKAESVFNSIKNSVQNCLDASWKVTSTDWKKVDPGRSKSSIFTEIENGIERYIKVSITDNAGTDHPAEKKFSVEIEINRK